MLSQVTSPSRGQVPVFSGTLVESDPGAQAAADLFKLDAGQRRRQINNHSTLVYSLDGRMAVSLKVPGFVDTEADYKSTCLIYDAAHWKAQPIGDFEYHLGWSVRLIIKATSIDAQIKTDAPSVLAASAQMGHTEATITFMVCGLATGDADDVAASYLQGEAASFSVDALAGYREKIGLILSSFGSDDSRICLNPVVLSRINLAPEPITTRAAEYRTWAYRLCGINGLLSGRTAEEWKKFMETEGKYRSQDGKTCHLVIADVSLFEQCVDRAYRDYGISGGSLNTLDPVKRSLIRSEVERELDGFAGVRHMPTI